MRSRASLVVTDIFFLHFLTPFICRGSVFPSLLLTSLACSPRGCSGLPREGVNHLCDSFALNIVKSSRGPGTFSSYPLMLVMLRSRHRDKSLIPERKALAGVMRDQSFYGYAHVCPYECWCLCTQMCL